MKIKDLAPYVYEKSYVYYEKTSPEDYLSIEYIDIFVGFLKEAPSDVLEKEVSSIGAKRKGILDIRVNM